MTDPIMQLYLFTRDLLVQPEGTVMFLGRTNMRRDDFTGLQIVVDQLAPSRRVSSGRQYSYTLGRDIYSATWTVPAILDFYGDGALAELQRFVGLLQSEAALDLKRALNIAVYRVSQITNVKLLTEESYSERYQIEMNLDYDITEQVVTDYMTTPNPDNEILAR